MMDVRSAAYVARFGSSCAHRRWSRAQVLLYGGAILIGATAIVCRPYCAWIVASYALAALFAASIAMRLAAMVATLVRDPTITIGTGDLEPAADHALPRYSILVPLYREPEVVPSLLSALAALDYPTDLLDIQILLEPDDQATLAALAAQTLPAWVRITASPPGEPRTKPRACNEGLARATGELLVVYDAEDRPEPDQLRKAVAAYRALPAATVCLQCRLAHYNSRQSLAAQWSALEYLLWFRLLLPGMQAIGSPVPLGGTSNHFRVAALRELGGWDPFNVTEDCDLGMRIARRGWRAQMLASTTWEEAVIAPRAWVVQRSRWIKGYFQTWLVHSRRGSLAPFGPWQWLLFALQVGAQPIIQLVNPASWLVILLWFIVGWSVVDVSSPLSIAALVLTIALIAANLLFVLVSLIACLVARRGDLALAALLSPLSWCLHSLAAWRAAVELIARPFRWNKTSHGLAILDSLRLPDSPAWRRAKLAAAAALVAATTVGAAYATRERLSEDIARQQPIRAVQLPLRFAAVETGARPLFEPGPVPPQPWTLVAATDAPRTSLPAGSLAFAARAVFPGVMSLVSHRMRDLSGMAAVAFDVRVEADAPEGLQILVHVRDEDGRWFQHHSRQHLLPGAWARIEMPLSDATAWTRIGHSRDWQPDLLRRIGELGIDILGYDRYGGAVQLANLRSIPAAADPPLEVLAIDEPRASCASMERWELAFALSRSYANPFDPDLIDVGCDIIGPDGTEHVSAFYAQEYTRRLEQGREVVEAVGSAGWRVRYRPRRAGAYRWVVQAVDGDHRRSEPLSGGFTAVAAAHSGYIGRSAVKPQYLAFSDGSPYYPIGHNLCQAVDLQRPYPYEFPVAPDQGTFTYDRYFARMRAAGMNWTRIWMTPWSFGLEGDPTWRDFHGLGRYNLANAWRFDALLAQAARDGVYVQPTIIHHAELLQENCWKTSALNAANGGCLHDPARFYTEPAVLAAFKKRMRYVVARWGDDPRVVGWEFFGEANLVPGYAEATAAAWHRALAEYVRGIDLGRHPIFTHCHNWQNGHALWALPGIDCVQGNGYIRPPNHTPDHVVNFARYIAEVSRYGKPVFVAEYGGRAELGAPSHDYLEAQLHSGLWASLTQPFAGTAMAWWWNFTDGADCYRHYRALSRFAADIDRLAHDYRCVDPRVDAAAGELRAAGMQDHDLGFYWVYQPAIFTRFAALPSIAGARLRLEGLDDGRYRVRCYDTRTGEIVGDEERDLRMPATIDLPPVAGDLGVKITSAQR
jgi:glycosyltransferase XagB